MRKSAGFLFALILTLTAQVSAMPHVDFSTLPDWVNPVFYQHFWNHQRFNAWWGGAGSGKSVAAMQRIAYRMVAETGHNYLGIRKVSESNRQSTYAEVLKWINTWHLEPLFKISDQAMKIECINGNTMIFRGMNDFRAREKVKSITFDNGPLTDIHVEEASELDEEDFNQLNLRLRGIALQPFQMTLTFNPIHVMHWLKRRLIDTPSPKTLVLHTTYLDNKFLDDGYREELESYKLTDPTYYDVYCLGKWGQLGEAAFPNAIFESCPFSFDDFDHVYAGQDFGYQHYNAIELIGVKDGELYSFREHYVRHLTNPDVILDHARRPVLAKNQYCRCDSAYPASIQEWSNAGYYVEGAVKGPGSVEAQFGYLRARKWHIDPEACPGLAAEVRGAVYKKDRQGNVTEEIFSFHDDALAACRYAVEELLTPQSAGVMGTFNAL